MSQISLIFHESFAQFNILVALVSVYIVPIEKPALRTIKMMKIGLSGKP